MYIGVICGVLVLGEAQLAPTAAVAQGDSRSSPSQHRLPNPRVPSYLNSRLLGYVAIGYVEPRTQNPLCR